MKTYLTRLLLLSTVCLLVACQGGQVPKVSSPSSTSSNQIATSSSPSSSVATFSSSSKQEISTTEISMPIAYQSILERYKDSLGQTAEVLSQDEVSSHLTLLTNQTYEYSGLFYSLYDINHDGAEELLLALDKSGEYVLIDLYTQLAGEDLRLVDNFRNIGFEIGPDARLYPLQDGTYLFEAEGVFRIYQYQTMIPGLKRISEDTSRPETATLLDLTSLTWTKLEK
ncbi:colicin lysis protein [Streptococcus sp. SS-4456]|uniref:colicin lysis protein n=1 Tax=Streptococcus sp. SS-4456 TaxID=3072286 RepID=UPI002FC65A07